MITVNGYSLIKEIGAGQFGRVMLAKDSQGMQFAIKTIPLPRLQRDPGLRTFLAKEAAVLLRLNSPHIVDFIEEFEAESQLWIVYEYCDKGSLEGIIKASKGMSEDAALVAFRDILLALAELERCNIVHRDIKPENILMKNNKVKLADFGLSLQGPSEGRLIGSPIYMAPEALERFEYTTKGDIYALGVTLFRLLTNAFPFYDKDFNGLLRKKKMFSENQLPQGLSWKLSQILMGCLNPLPAARMGVAELLDFIDREYSHLRTSPNQQHSKRQIQCRPSVCNNQLTFLTKKPSANPLQTRFNISPSDNQSTRQPLGELDFNKPAKITTAFERPEQGNQSGVPFSRRLSNQKSPLMRVYQDKSHQLGQGLVRDSESGNNGPMNYSRVPSNCSMYSTNDFSFTFQNTTPVPSHGYQFGQRPSSYRLSTAETLVQTRKQSFENPLQGWYSPQWRTYKPN